MYTFSELRKANKLVISGEEKRLAVIGNVATQFFSTGICGAAKLAGINLNVLDTDYNQIDAQLFDQASEVYSFAPDYILLWLSSEKLYEEFLDLPIEKKAAFADYYIEKLQQWWEKIALYSNARIIQPNLVEIDDKVLGQYSSKTNISFTYQIRKLNYLMQLAMESANNIFPVDFSAIQNSLGRNVFHDPVIYFSSKMSVAINALPCVAKAVTDVIKSSMGRIKKCIILDLDNTLWGGVIGDDGVGGIEIGELGRGHAFSNFQRWLKSLKECGIILAVCSKNNEDIAKEPFEQNDEMILKLSDISVFVANWDDKASNIRLIKDTLNIGMDSIVFLDDNPFERNLVRQLIPEITVPELPEDPAQYVSFLQNENLFDTASYTGAGSDRTKLYQEEFERKKSENTFDSIDDYLESLDMIGEAKPFEPSKYARIAQLSQRSNQFNLRTIRYTENEIAKIAESENYFTLFFTLKDKFGDYGLVSAVVLQKADSHRLFIDTWFMSCRVLKRGMEDFIINSVFDVAKTNNYDIIVGEYIPTPKNKMVENIYSEKGFVKIADNRYELSVHDYKYKQVFIKNGEKL